MSKTDQSSVHGSQGGQDTPGNKGKSNVGAGAGARVPRPQNIGQMAYSAIGSTVRANQFNMAVFSEGAMSPDEAMACIECLRQHPGFEVLTSADDPQLLMAVLEAIVIHGDAERAYMSETTVVLSIGGQEFKLTYNELASHLFVESKGGEFPIKRFARAFPQVVSKILYNPVVVAAFQENFGQHPIFLRSALLPTGHKAKYNNEEVKAVRNEALWQEKDHESGAANYLNEQV